jgi:hypothetical protein
VAGAEAPDESSTGCAASDSDRSATPAAAPIAASSTAAPTIDPTALRLTVPSAPLARATARRRAPSASINVRRTMRGMTGSEEPCAESTCDRVTGSGVGVSKRPRGGTTGRADASASDEKVSTGQARSNTAPLSNGSEDIEECSSKADA